MLALSLVSIGIDIDIGARIRLGVTVGADISIDF